jgi:hypothetical protein
MFKRDGVPSEMALIRESLVRAIRIDCLQGVCVCNYLCMQWQKGRV